MPLPAALEFPRKADFNIADGYTYINGAYTHPMPRVAADAARKAAEVARHAVAVRERRRRPIRRRCSRS